MPDLADNTYWMVARRPLGRIVFAECPRRSKEQAIDSGNAESMKIVGSQKSGGGRRELEVRSREAGAYILESRVGS